LPDGVAMHVKGALNFFKHADRLEFLGHNRMKQGRGKNA
jgi:hypothetical protein